MSSSELFSVIVPAFKAQNTIERALSSIERCGLPNGLVEVIVAPDDGRFYAVKPSDHLTIRQLDPIPPHVGAGPTRNRAIDVARGQFVAFLDADDTWEAGYLIAALPLVLQAGVVFSPTSVIEKGTEILRLCGQHGMIGFEDIADTGASFFPIVRRSEAGPFREGASQDVLHSVELIATHGGRCPITGVAYQHRSNPLSTSMVEGFSAEASAAYQSYIDDIVSGHTRMSAHLRDSAAEVFRRKLRLNEEYRRIGRPGMSYYGFIASRYHHGSLPPLPSRPENMHL